MLQRTKLFAIGNHTTRADLTDVYSGNVSDAYNVGNAVQLFLEVEYTMGATESGNSIDLIVEFADPLVADSTPEIADWYRLGAVGVSTSTATADKVEYVYTADSVAGTYDRFILDIPNGHEYIRISVKETGRVANFGKCSVKLVAVEDENIN